MVKIKYSKMVKLSSLSVRSALFLLIKTPHGNLVVANHDALYKSFFGN